MRHGRELIGYGTPMLAYQIGMNVQAGHTPPKTDSSSGRFDVLAGKPPTTTIIALPEPGVYRRLAERKCRAMLVVVSSSG